MMLTLRIYGLEDIEFSEFSEVSLHVRRPTVLKSGHPR